MSSPIAKTYDPKKIVITFAGIPLSGFADGTFIQVTQPAQRFTKHVGADGEVARARSNDDTHEVTITLLQTSLSNTYLSQMAEADRISNLGIGSLQITDLNGTTLRLWPQAWIRQDPEMQDGKEISDRAWIFDTSQVAENAIGGQIL